MAGSWLDGFNEAITEFRNQHPRKAGWLDSPCECDQCERRRTLARNAWNKWLRRRRERREKEKGDAPIHG